MATRTRTQRAFTFALATCYLAGFLGWLLSAAAAAEAPALEDASRIPHVDEQGRSGYREFAAAPQHRAYAIAPGGTWAWVSGGDTPEGAEAEALAACRQYTEQPCHIYALDGQVVLDANAWAASWNFHMDAAEAAQAAIGAGRGNRFPDLALIAPDGRAVTLSEFKGKPVFVHFWGSWCPPCQGEFTDLQRLYDAMADDGAIAFVLVQGREAVAKSRRWAEKHGYRMPLYDSGHRGHGNKAFRLADGTTIKDRRLATAYPSSYVLDANGLVVFRHAGPVEGWAQYETLLRNLAAEAGS